MKWHIDNQEDSDSYGIYDEAHNLVASVQDESKAGLIVTLPEMLAMLGELEWSDGGSCPSCEGYYCCGHEDDCTLGNLLQRIRGEKG